MSNITTHEGKKYIHVVNDCITGQMFNADVYSVLEAFAVTCPARAHAIKKLLCCGTRGKGDALADLVGTQAAMSRAIELEKLRPVNAEFEVKDDKPKS
jgi:hypothetical protein